MATIVRRWRLFTVLALLAMMGVLFGSAVRRAKDAARVNSCNCHLKQLGLAFQNYHDTYKCFPPAYIADANGRPMHSWRVLILPYLEEQDFYKQYRFDEPWDGPNNSKLAAKSNTLQFFCPAADGDSSETCYVVVTGPETAWPGSQSLAIRDIRDGTSKTIAIVEVVHSGIHWMEPRDLTLDKALRGINTNTSGLHIGSNHVGGVNVGCLDAHVSFLPNDFPVEDLRALLTASGGEPVAPPE